MNKVKVIIALIAAVVVTLVFVFVYLPFQQDLDKMLKEEANLRIEYQRNMDEMSQLQQLQDEAIRLEEEVKILALRFFNDRTQEEYYVKLKQLFEVDNDTTIILENISNSGEGSIIYQLAGSSTAESSEEDGEGGEGEESVAANPLSEATKTTQFTVDFNCSYEELAKLLRKIDTEDKYITVDSITISPDSESSDLRVVASLYDIQRGRLDSIQIANELSVNMSLNFCYLSGLDDLTYDPEYVNILVRDALIKTGIINPFVRVILR